MNSFVLPAEPDAEQIETAQLLIDQHRSDHNGQCPALTCAVGAKAPPWPCGRWRWSMEVLRRAGLPVANPEGRHPSESGNS
ncbi:hypothetical protein GCM10020369_42460 [Cryptosporangium minutisporangium]|uniref:Uncharacterized protein n=1 Tax=Cryptosporangium minutisporangium TaxID=113569 RepID=A0ABP6T0G3_9ACTN